MAAAIMRAITNLRLLIETETDADSPDNETTYAALREMVEILYKLMVSDGFTGTASANPPDDNTGVLTHAGAAQSVDEHNGRTLVITSGNARGNFYTIDDTAAQTITCTGDNLYSDGVRSGDYFEVFYDIKTNSDGHDHDGVNSKSAVLADTVIVRAKLATGTGDVTAELNAAASVDIVLQDYSFGPSTYNGGGEMPMYASATATADYVARYRLSNSTGGALTYHNRYRYVTASNDPFIYALRDNNGEIKALWMCDDPPEGYWGLPGPPDDFEPPIKMYNPQGRYTNKDYDEIILFRTDGEFIKEVRARARSEKRELLKVFNKYEYKSDKKLFVSKNLNQV